MKEEILYCKYSNERDNKFKIRTEIIKKEDGSKFVKKTALTKESQNHINKVFESYKLLKELFADSKIHIDICEKSGNSLSFNFIEGSTLEEKLDELLYKKDYIGIINKINEYVHILKDKMELQSFTSCEEFESVFGKVNLNNNLKGCNINDVDLNFNNILLVKDDWYIIDYEWTFNFCVPLNYIIYRAIFWYIENAEKRAELRKLDLYKVVGISDDEVKEYKRMEENFQKYVLGNWKQLSSLYGKTTPSNIDIKEIIKNQKNENSQEAIKIYYDYGKGFSEENSQIINKIKTHENNVEFEISVSNLVKNVRIDPLSWYGLVRIDKIFGTSDIVYSINYITNGMELTSDLFLFGNKDPQIILTNLKTDTNKIKVAFEVQLLSEEQFIKLNNYIEKIKQENNKIKNEIKLKREIILKYERKNNELNKKLELVSKQCEDLQLTLNNVKGENVKLKNENNIITNSMSWKITKPVRLLLDVLKKQLKSTKYELENENIEENEPDDGIKYNLDKLQYKESVLYIEGWIFNENAEISSISVILDDNSNEYELNDISLFERKDVSNVYNNDNALVSGFRIKILIKNNKKLSVYIKHGERKIFIDNIAPNIEDENKPIFIEKVDNEFNPINLIKYEANNITSKLEIPEEIYNNIVDIIIPIYNGYDYLNKLFSSIKRTKMKYRLIVINDKSPDLRINEFLDELLKDNNNIIILQNDENLGFVKSVNKALRIVENNVALVNTDVELPEMWLERLMIPIVCNEDIASSTPFTNSGTICSFPEFCKNNELFENMNLDEIDAVFKTIIPRYELMPTGVGFCMGMNKKVLEQCGELDEETFSKGYGEENDWCQRAIKLGYKNVHVENLFVYHKHGGSFLSEQKKKLIERNLKLLGEKHPNYNSDVANYCSVDPNGDIRNYAKFSLLCKKVELSLYFNHRLGGGASKYLNKKIESNILNGKASAEISYDVSNELYYFEYKYKNYEFLYYFLDLNKLFEFLNNLKIKDIYINELVTYIDIKTTLNYILKLKKNKNANLIMLMHDLYCICPTVNLLNDSGEYCNLPNSDVCKECLCNCKFNMYLNCSDINEWRDIWNDFLLKCDKIICFSDNTKLLLEKIYSLDSKIVINPHKIAPMVALNKKYKYTKTLNIGLLGILSYHKGIEVIKSLIRNIEDENLEINIILIGKSEEKIESKHFMETGNYTVDSIPKLILEYDIDLFFISSIWPETFSYTTQEIIELNVPLLSFDIGAQGDKVKKFEKGSVIDSYDPKVILNKIIEHSKKFTYRMAEENKILFILEYVSFSSRYRVDHLREKLLFYGIQSDCIMTNEIEKCNIKEYNSFIIYRCRSNDNIDKFVKRCNSENKKVYYDIDDYIFNYNDIKNMEFLQNEEYVDFEKYTSGIYKCMDKCDGFITSTINMEKAIKNAFNNKPICINRNAVSLEMALLSLEAKYNKIENEDKITIGYFSGSNTHNSDFELIEDILIESLKNNSNVYLKIVGCLKLSEKFEKYYDRIEFVDFVEWKKLPELIASVDINLLPLENNFFTSCKSENKWTEAALVGVPTLMSFNTEFEQIVKDKENALICRDQDEWKVNLQKMIDDKSYRLKIAKNAHEYVIQNYITINSDNKVIDLILND